jgi:catechol 2,3-dioxygenase-like lactoylglutathione lyase family enzyme
MIRSIVDVAVLVSKATKSAEWYRDKLGFEIRSLGNGGSKVGPNAAFCGKCGAVLNR